MSSLNSIKHRYDYVKNSITSSGCYLRVFDVSNTSNYATFNITAYAGASAYSYLFTASYVVAETTITDLTLISTYGIIFEIKQPQIGVANGVCPLNGSGKIDNSFLDPSVMTFMGVWDANTNTPTLSNGGAHGVGDVYLVSVAGTQFTISFAIGDFAVYDGTNWNKITGLTVTVGVISVTAGSSKISIGGTVQNPTVDVAENQLTISNTSGQLNATRIATGIVDNTEFEYLNGVTSNIQTQFNNKIDTLTSSNNFLVVSGSLNSRTLQVKPSVYLVGNVVINSSGLLLLDSVSQTGEPYFTASSIMTVACDIVINGSLTIDASSTLIVEGDILVIGNCTINLGGSLNSRGICQIRTGTTIINGGSIVSFDEVSIRNTS
jgi:hypothetical protein